MADLHLYRLMLTVLEAVRPVDIREMFAMYAELAPQEIIPSDAALAYGEEAVDEYDEIERRYANHISLAPPKIAERNG